MGCWIDRLIFIEKISKIVVIVSLMAPAWGCAGPAAEQPTQTPVVERKTLIPPGAVKMGPETDSHPPEVLSSEYEKPVPVPGSINTAGGEDSDFVTPDGNILYFFYTPDINVPVETQLLDGVTGLYESNRVDGLWGKPQRIILHDSGQLSLDGCYFIHGNVMWFCSAREGYTGLHWFTAEFQAGRWQNWQIADFNPSYEVGELYISNDGNALYFHSARPGGKGGLDIWMSTKVDGVWQEPVNVSAVNTDTDEGWPALNPAEDELWFTHNYGVWRSKKSGGEWQTPELIISPLAGEPSIDAAGNIYFVHHYLKDGQLIESDIYVAYKKP